MPRSMPMIGSFCIGVRGVSGVGQPRTQDRPGRLAEIPDGARFGTGPQHRAAPGAFGAGPRQARLSVAVGQGTRVNAKECLESVGAEVSRDFVQNRTLLSFEEYVDLALQSPRSQARNAAQYLRDAMEYFGSQPLPHPTGSVRRFQHFRPHRG